MKIFILFIFLISSCSYVNRRNTEQPETVVDILSDDTKLPIINSINNPLLNERDPKLIKRRTPVLALHMGPGLYNTVSYAGMLKFFNKNKINIHMVTGSGMGLLVAALYAKSASPSVLEWELFKIFQKLDNFKPVYSANWRKEFRSIVLNFFSGLKIEDLKISLMVPVYDKNSDEVIYLSRGNLVSSLLKSLAIGPISDYKILPSFEREIFNDIKVANKGADIVLNLDSFAEARFDQTNRYLNSLYSKIRKNIEFEKPTLDSYFQLKLSSFYLDNLKHFTDLVSAGEQQAVDLKTMLDEKTNKWYETKDI